MATYLVVHPYIDIYGGGERVCHNVMKTLIDHGQKVGLLTFDFDASRYRDIMGEDLPQSVTIHSLGRRITVEPPFTIYKRHRDYVKLLKKFRTQLEYDYLFSTQSSPFEPVFLNKAKKNVAYVHFPEIHFDYNHSNFKRKLYLWLFKYWVEQGINKLDMIFCNSNYTKDAIQNYWKKENVKEPIIVYPPVNLNQFRNQKPFSSRRKRVVYVARFIKAKRHEIIKQLASDLPDYEFMSVGGLLDSEKEWFSKLGKDLPENYLLKANLPGPQLREILQDSRIYVHLMEGEHFGISPIEGLASGCITIVHDSGGMREFIPEEFRWRSYSDLKQKVVVNMQTATNWESHKGEWSYKISSLSPENFQERIWSELQKI